MRCAKPGCENEVTQNQQKYCSRDHAPYGNFGAYNTVKPRLTLSEGMGLSGSVATGEPLVQSLRSDKTINKGLLETSQIQSYKKNEDNKIKSGVSETQKSLKREDLPSGWRSPTTSEKLSLTTEWQKKKNIARKSTERGESGMLGSEKSTVAKSVSAGSVEILPTAYVESLTQSAEGKFLSLNLIDESTTQLNELMKKLVAKKDFSDTVTINAACNIAKQIQSNLRLKLDIFREMKASFKRGASRP